MKKIISICALAALAIAATPEEAAQGVLGKMLPPGASAQASKKMDITDGWVGLEVSIKDPSGNVVGSDLVFSNGHLVTPVLWDAQSGKDYKAEYAQQQQKQIQEAIKKGIPEYVKNHSNIVRLGDKGGLATVVFSDPDCPYCRKHFEGIEEELKKHDVVMILTPLPMHKNALNKATLLLAEIKKLGEKASTAQKVAVFKKYFSDGEFAQAAQADKDALDKQVQDAFALGVNYTPAIFEDMKI